MNKTPRQERNERLAGRLSGSMASSSADFMHLVQRLHAQSAAYNAKHDHNFSPFAWAGIPILFSAVRCFAIEHASYWPRNDEILSKLVEGSDFKTILDFYNVPAQLKNDAELIWEIRNEIIHPGHLPTGTGDNWPNSLRTIKDQGLLHSAGSDRGDYDILHQMASHKLFTHCVHVIRGVVVVIIESDPQKSDHFHDFVGWYMFC